MRIWTASTTGYDHSIDFVRKVIALHKITYLIDLRLDSTIRSHSLGKSNMRAALKNYDVEYRDLSKLLGQAGKRYDRDLLISKLKTDRKTIAAMNLIYELSKVNELCLLGHNSKYRTDVRNEIAHLVKEKINRTSKETVYLIHI